MGIFSLSVTTLEILLLAGTSRARSRHQETDYCALLGQDDIQGIKHGFLAGNNVTPSHDHTHHSPHW